MNEKYVAFAIPFFFLLIGLEALGLRRRGIKNGYRFPDSITNLACGVGQQVLEPFFKVVALAPYAWLWSHARVGTVSMRSPLAWIVLVLGIDLGYYVFHRASHRVGFLWAVHSVHHQSEEYNLSVALRQPWLQALASPCFYLPLAVAGFPPEMLLGGITIDTIYQFWIHTRLVGRLGPLEWVLNTPSHHRVHHGIDPEYLDRNYAGIFIFWDRLFGTFQEEQQPPVYGTVKLSPTCNAIQLNVNGWRDLVQMSRATKSRSDKIRVWLAPPEWRPFDLGGPVEPAIPDPHDYPRYAPPVSPSMQAYVTIQFAVMAVATMVYLWFESTASWPVLAAAAAVFGATLISWAGLLERKSWAWPLEGARLGAAMAFIAVVVFVLRVV
jgi:sterol desaturase/sphingolipid hydroxylase (fatty acid hydroxylase superfamily)